MRIKVAVLITLVLSIVSASPGDTQQIRKLFRIGWVATNKASPAFDPYLEYFRQGLRARAYEEGKTVIIEQRYAGDTAQRFPDLIRELIRAKSDVILTLGAAATAAARTIGADVPVIFITDDPVAEGIVESLERPPTGLTGLALLNHTLNGKRLELLKEALSNVSRVAVLTDSSSRPTPLQLNTMEAAARSTGVNLLAVEARNTEEIAKAFEMAVRERADALVPLPSTLFVSRATQIVTLAAKNRLPAIYEHRGFVEAGGLLSYGPDVRDLFLRAAGYVDEIYKGRKPNDLPVGKSTKFELVVNLKTAKALQLTMPPPLMARADHVIDP